MCVIAARPLRKRSRGGAELGFSAVRISHRLVSRARATGKPGLPDAGIITATLRSLAAVSFCSGFVLDRRPMKYLLYCVFRSVPQPELEALTGVGGKPVLVIDHGGLGAAISELREPDSLPDVAAILA